MTTKYKDTPRAKTGKYLPLDPTQVFVRCADCKAYELRALFSEADRQGFAKGRCDHCKRGERNR